MEEIYHGRCCGNCFYFEKLKEDQKKVCTNSEGRYYLRLRKMSPKWVCDEFVRKRRPQETNEISC